ncbi:glycosyltransferase family 2 protein [Actinoplanes sp. NPDC051343]|jgi:glycosyltransferase involved in cell wall biosynthesis|uniref:glycosyltransferase family 2 protein n=1 Tax=Actinoplanes sp. NPDC051343 TaxID=3363906 RepID=UPI0037A3F3E6
MSNAQPVLSICLPVRNAGPEVAGTIRSILAQTETDIELVISDNASTDDTEDVCRELARADRRVAYHRQPENIGLLPNFIFAMNAAHGRYFRWIGDDDRLEPEFASRCLAEFAADPRLILVTTGISYTAEDGTVATEPYESTALRSDDPAVRFGELMRLLNASHLMIDPMYGMMRRDVVAALPRRNMLHEDEIFAGKLALAGPWGHLPEVLAHRHWADDSVAQLGRLLNVPRWQWRMRNALQARETADYVNGRTDLTAEQRRQAMAAIRKMYLARQWKLVRRRSKKLVRLATAR